MKKWQYIAGGIVVIVLVAVIFFALGEKAATPSAAAPTGPDTSITATTSPSAPSTATTTTTNATTKKNSGTSSQTQQATTQLGPYFGEKESASLGLYLTDNKGRTLYTYSNDRPDSSNCLAACLQIWPAYGPGISDTGTFSIPMLPVNINTTKGNLGMVQFTWKNMPLYYYSKDTQSGDTFGEGLNGTWFVVNL